MVFDFPGTFSTGKAALDMMSGKMTPIGRIQIAGKENVHAQNERHTETEIRIGPGPAADRPHLIDRCGNGA